MTSVCGLCWILWIYIQILQQTCLGKSWFVMYSGTTITVSTSSNFKIKGTVYSEIKELFLTNISRKSLIAYLSFSVPKIDAKYSAISVNATFPTKRLTIDKWFSYKIIDVAKLWSPQNIKVKHESYTECVNIIFVQNGFQCRFTIFIALFIF